MLGRRGVIQGFRIEVYRRSWAFVGFWGAYGSRFYVEMIRASDDVEVSRVSGRYDPIIKNLMSHSLGFSPIFYNPLYNSPL